jgi:hypothetical protein
MTRRTFDGRSPGLSVFEPAAYVDTLSKKHIPLVGNLVAAAHMALLEPAEFEIVKAIEVNEWRVRWQSGIERRAVLLEAAGDGGHACSQVVRGRLVRL